MKIDDYLVTYDVTEVHSVRVLASIEQVYESMIDIKPSEINGVMRLLIWLRTLPEKLVGRREEWMSPERPMLAQMTSGGFTLLEEQPNREIVMGMVIPGSIGRVWDKTSNLEIRCQSASEFLAFDRPEFVKVVTNLTVEETETPGMVLIRTETRCKGLSPQSLTRFKRYWTVIRPFSGLIRIVWLRGIKRKAERSRLVAA